MRVELELGLLTMVTAARACQASTPLQCQLLLLKAVNQT